MATEKQIAANRRNATRSTGPTSPQGKSVCRLNSTTHGMTAKTAVLPGEDQGAFDAKVDAWIEAFEPSDDVEKSLIAAAAKAFWRHERVQRIHAKKLASRIRNYPEEYAHKLEGDANALGKRLMEASVRGGDANDPRDLVHKLEGTLHGCQWLLDGCEDSAWRSRKTRAGTRRSSSKLSTSWECGCRARITSATWSPARRAILN